MGSETTSRKLVLEKSMIWEEQLLFWLGRAIQMYEVFCTQKLKILYDDVTHNI